LFIRTDHFFGSISHKLGACFVPEHDPVVPADDKGGDRRSFNDPLDGLNQSKVFVQFALEGFRVSLQIIFQFRLPRDVLECLNDGDDLAFLIVNRRRQKIKVPACPAEIFKEIAGLPGPFDHCGFLHPLLAVIFFQALCIIVHNQIGDNRAFFLIKWQILLVRADHLRSLITHEIGASLVPEHDFMIPANNKGRNRRSFNNPLDGLLFTKKLVLPVFTLPQTPPLPVDTHLPPTGVGERQAGNDDRQCQRVTFSDIPVEEKTDSQNGQKDQDDDR